MASFDSFYSPQIATPNFHRFGHSPERASSFASPFDIARHELHVNAKTQPAAIQHPFGPHAVCANPLWSPDGLHDGWQPSPASYDTLYPFVKSEHNGLRQAGSAAYDPRRLLLDFDNAETQRLSSLRHQSVHGFRDHDSPRSIGSSSPTFLEYFESDRFKRSCLSRMDNAWATNVNILSKWRPLLQPSPSVSHAGQQHLVEDSPPSMLENGRSAKEVAQSDVRSDEGDFKQTSPAGGTHPEQPRKGTPSQVRIPKLMLPPPPTSCQEDMGPTPPQSTFQEDVIAATPSASRKMSSHVPIHSALVEGPVNDESVVAKSSVTSSGTRKLSRHAPVTPDLLEGRDNDKSDASKMACVARVMMGRSEETHQASTHPNPNLPNLELDQLAELESQLPEASFVAPEKAKIKQLEKKERTKAPRRTTVRVREEGQQGLHSEEMEMRLQALEEYVVDLQCTKTQTSQELQDRSNDLLKVETVLRDCEAECLRVKHEEANLASRLNFSQRAKSKIKGRTNNATGCLIAEAEEAREKERHALEHLTEANARATSAHRMNSQLRQRMQMLEAEHREASDEHAATNHAQRQRHVMDLMKSEEAEASLEDELAELRSTLSEEVETQLLKEEGRLNATRGNMHEEKRLAVNRANELEKKLGLSAKQLAALKAREHDLRSEVSRSEEKLKAQDVALRSELKNARQEQNEWKEEAGRCAYKERQSNQKIHMLQPRFDDTRKELEGARSEYTSLWLELERNAMELCDARDEMRQESENFEEERMTFSEELAKHAKKERMQTQSITTLNAQLRANARINADALKENERLKGIIAQSEHQIAKSRSPQESDKSRRLSPPQSSSPRSRLYSSPAQSSSPRSRLYSSPAQSSSPRSRVRSSLQSTAVDMTGCITEAPKRRSRRHSSSGRQSVNALGDHNLAGDSAGVNRTSVTQASLNSKAEAAGEAAASLQEGLHAASRLEASKIVDPRELKKHSILKPPKHRSSLEDSVDPRELKKHSILKPPNHRSSLEDSEKAQVSFNPQVSEKSAA